jgi:hypothetical protein
LNNLKNMIVTEFTIDVHTGLGLWNDVNKSYLRYYLKKQKFGLLVFMLLVTKRDCVHLMKWDVTVKVLIQISIQINAFVPQICYVIHIHS